MKDLMSSLAPTGLSKYLQNLSQNGSSSLGSYIRGFVVWKKISYMAINYSGGSRGGARRNPDPHVVFSEIGHFL